MATHLEKPWGDYVISPGVVGYMPVLNILVSLLLCVIHCNKTKIFCGMNGALWIWIGW